MASDSFTTLGPSDSGFLNSFFTPTPSTPLQSRVGEKPKVDTPASDNESVLEEEPALENEPTADAPANLTVYPPKGPTDEQLDAALRATPLPEGFLARMRRVADDR